MQTTNTPLPKSRLQMEFELPPERLTRAMDDAARVLSRERRIAGFRPGKAPRAIVERMLGAATVHDEAVEILVQGAYRDAVREQEIDPLVAPEIEVTQAEAGKPVLFKAIVQVRPEVKLGDFENFKFGPEVDAVDETMVEKVVDELRDSESHLEPVDRAAEKGDYAVVAFDGTRDGEKFVGGHSEKMPLQLGEERLYPGFDEHIIGLRKGEETEFDLAIPDDFPVEALRGANPHFNLTLKDLRGKVVPEANDEFARSVGRFRDLDHLKAELRKRLEGNALDRARHQFADKIVEYAAANATSIEMPDVLVDQEIDVMRDEIRSTMARQGITDEMFLAATGKTEAEFRLELAPQAEKRVKSLFVLAEIAKAKGIEVPEADIDAEVARARTRYANDRDMVRYFESDRGRRYIRSTFERSRTVEQLVDEWLAAHPEAPRLQHIEDMERDWAAAAAAEAEAEAAATVASAGPDEPGSLASSVAGSPES